MREPTHGTATPVSALPDRIMRHLRTSGTAQSAARLALDLNEPVETIEAALHTLHNEHRVLSDVNTMTGTRMFAARLRVVRRRPAGSVPAVTLDGTVNA